MKYTRDELHQIILPMVLSLGKQSPEQLTNAIVEVIIQDREANVELEDE